MLYCLKAARYYNFALSHPCLDYLVEEELGWFGFCFFSFRLPTGFSTLKICFHMCLASNNTLCHIKGAAAFQGIPFNFLAEVTH